MGTVQLADALGVGITALCLRRGAAGDIVPPEPELVQLMVTGRAATRLLVWRAEARTAAGM